MDQWDDLIKADKEANLFVVGGDYCNDLVSPQRGTGS